MEFIVKNREPAIDLMRFIGLTMIVFAHLSLPATNVFFQLRTFDVPMMIFISGLSYSGRDTGPALRFIWNRTRRLLIPVYLFLTLFFLIRWGLSAMGLTVPIPAEKIIGSYQLRLNPSINFVWIFRVFLIVMLMTPFLVSLEKKLPGWIPAVLIFAGMVLAQHFLVGWLKPLKLGWFVNDWILYVLGYGSLFFLGLVMRHQKTGTGTVITLLILCAFLLMTRGVSAEKGSWLRMQSFKYPPQTYYVLWGALCSCLIWLTRKVWLPVLNWKPFLFIGQNTIWIYLWHIVPGYPYYRSTAIPYGWKFVLLYFVPIAIYLLHFVLVTKLGERHPSWKPYLKYLKG